MGILFSGNLLKSFWKKSDLWKPLQREMVFNMGGNRFQAMSSWCCMSVSLNGGQLEVSRDVIACYVKKLLYMTTQTATHHNDSRSCKWLWENCTLVWVWGLSAFVLSSFFLVERNSLWVK